MSSELELSKQRITELEAENSGLRIKLSVSDAEIAELKHSNIEFLRANKEYNERRDAENAKLKARIEEMESEFEDRITKVEQKQTLQSALTANYNSSNNSSSNFNLVVDQVLMVTHHKKPLVDTSLPEDKETDAFLGEVHKKKVSNEIRQRNQEKKLYFSASGQTQKSLPIGSQRDQRPQVLDSITQPCNSASSEVSANSDGGELYSQEPLIEQNHVTEISETLCPRKITSDKSSIDEASQYLAQLCDKAFDAEDKTNRANQEEILCWCLYAKDFIIQLNEIIESRGVGLDKIKYIKSYSATSISELTNEQIQKVIDYGVSSEKISLVTDHVTKISETLCPRKNLSENTPDQNNVLEVLSSKESTALISLAHPSNSSDNSKEKEDDDDSDPNDSEKEMPDDSNDDGYNDYGGYNEYSERDRELLDELHIRIG
ncbi:hypothetical protein GLOIN_2v1770198 [Rhizophagus irregularis DAOM 181602=DAOM 197198]|uniref:Uncharacterized protein n=1 Tax=Rhizophagus irregularis (strain DAOM 181602 / DAOM 197198 / MUCL 43194) TaxID=747089 RepID=A0A2P4QCH3_RHIID|nr:hypothetical protein GLOIN_2v1770198 [Rhizophagus irregularis DAOM 181602=DAOM 197198]POG75340.1 hypothetical protein GLOIN_2v1770198 [Rhizophagus irregularis DAOM 181602=DAOM 197198]|eukprot:XP_025182206.1 hypothetical protein GLOIN_2v1770198 [Rhizophagus irregularis DAOM 181602=DAOM 197198]